MGTLPSVSLITLLPVGWDIDFFMSSLPTENRFFMRREENVIQASHTTRTTCTYQGIFLDRVYYVTIGGHCHMEGRPGRPLGVR